MTKDEALKLALELIQDYVDEHGPHDKDSGAQYVVTAIKEALMSGTDGAQPEQEPEYKGWYCAHCQRGVDGSEVTYHEQHTVCGRVITDDLPPKTQPWEKFCDSNCVWTDHHPDCKLAEQEPVALETVYETIIHWDEGGGKRSRRELARRIVSLYTTPPQRPSRSDIKPLTDEEIWVLTSEYNDYDQHGEYFEAVFIGKPTSKQIQKHCHVTEQGAVHILNGGGRVKYEDQWYNLRKEKAAHGIKELKEYKK